jgi:hypothetical protein
MNQPKRSLTRLIFILAGIIFAVIAFEAVFDYILHFAKGISLWFCYAYPTALIIVSAVSFYCAFRNAK